MVFGRSDATALAVRLSSPIVTDHLVDIGCGPGSAARTVARQVALVTGVDPATVMLRFARAIPSPRNARWIHADVESLPLTEGEANVIWAIATVHHWKDLDLAVREIRRVLAPGGRFVATEREIAPDAVGHASHGWLPEHGEQFAGMCRTAGFLDVTHSREVSGDSQFIAVVAHAPS